MTDLLNIGNINIIQINIANLFEILQELFAGWLPVVAIVHSHPVQYSAVRIQNLFAVQ